jgi:hypothetical protein
MDMPPEAGMGIAGIGMAADTDIAPVAVVVVARAVVADFEQTQRWGMPRQELGLLRVRVLFSLFCLLI